MLTDLHNAIRSLLFDQGNIPALEVDVRFEAPTRDWIGSLTRPTISVFLYDVQENLELRYTNFQTRREGSRSFTKADPRLFDFRFMVSVLSSEIADEHAILYRLLYTLLKYVELPSDLLPQALVNAPIGVLCRVDQPSETSSRLTDIWSALEVPPRPALAYVVTLPVDTEETFEAPLVLTRTARYRSTLSGLGGLEELGFHIGGTVRDASGASVPGVGVVLEGTAQAVITDAEGRFVFTSVRRGTMRLQVSIGAGKPSAFEFEVPATSYDLKVR